MKHSFIPRVERAQLSSYDEVVIAALESDVNDIECSPVQNRIRDLEIAGGTHYYRFNGYLGAVTMLTQDFKKIFNTKSERLRESIVTLQDNEVHHYVLNMTTGQLAFLAGKIALSPESNNAIADAISPPLIEVCDDQFNRLKLGSGVEYDTVMLRRVRYPELYVEPDVSAIRQSFLSDTERFLSDNAVIHTTPIVVPSSWYANFDKQIAA